jgi:hypothetical protein
MRTEEKYFINRDVTTFFMITLYTILDDVLPADVFGPVEVGMMKTELAVSSLSLIHIVDSTRRFRAQLAELSFALMNLPFTVVVVEEDFPRAR